MLNRLPTTLRVVIKPIHVWLLGLYDHLRDNSDTIIKRFAGIKYALVMELQLEDPLADLDT